MAAYLLQNLPQRITDSNGEICSGAKLYTYVTGTTTPKTAYQNAAGSVAHANPVIADSAGQFPQVFLTADSAYRIKVTKSDGTTLSGYPLDNISGNGAGVLQELTGASLAPIFATVDSGGGGGTAYSQASYISRKNIALHAWYDFVSNSIHNYTAGQPIVGHASFNDNNTIAGTVASDHHHSFQSDFHYTCSATLGVGSSFWSQADISGGTITELSGLKVNNPTGVGGTVGTHYGAYIGALTRGTTNNWGLYSLTKSFVGGQLWLGTAGGPQALIEYSSDLGHVQVQPRAGYSFKVGAAAGDRKLRLGDPTTDSFDATIENASDGRLTLTPRSGFGLFLNGTVETGPVIASGPVVMASYTVGTLPSAATYVRGRVYVTDANATTFNSVVAGGGSNKVPVFSEGTNWRIG
jgi:hypothetical protein